MTRVLLLGRVVLDHRFWVERFPPAANRTPTLDYVEAVGGPAAVAAETVAQIGGEAVFIGRRGDDPAGERVETLLRKQAVDTRHLRAVPGARTPVAAVLIDSRGDRFIFPYAGAGLPETTHWIPLRELDRANAVLVDSRWPAGAAVLSRAARAVGLPVVVDLDTDSPEAWAVAAAATHAIADEELATRCGGVAAVLNRLARARTWGAVTLGPGGVAHAAGRMPAFPVPAHDTTGAGDVFHGAFVLAIAEHRGEDEALRRASAAAAVRCRMGRVPTRSEVESLLAAESDTRGTQ
ncbi:MAG TPA: PfkB family carbohydrate kinase [bacterium]|nr:PfkB family carbohydrate kinase [bacterium]